jgi:hypothetical protein
MRARGGVADRWRFRVAADLLAAMGVGPAFADDPWSAAIERATDTAQSQYGSHEAWSGVDAARDQWLLYSGMTIAPWSRDIYSDGWRLRFGGGYGQYGYDTSLSTVSPCGGPLTPACVYDRKHLTVEHAYAEALLGYYLQLGRLTAKVFAGASMSSQHHTELSPESASDGAEYGAKGALEFWLNVSDTAWTSLDASYATARNESSSRWRAGWRLQPRLSVGPELRYDKNVETGDGDWNGRAGLFARYDWVGGEASLAGGVAGRVEGQKFGDQSAYGTFNVLFQY